MTIQNTALLIIDVQYDFLPPSGSLAVPNGDEILPIIHNLIDKEKWDWPVIVASQDYHPKKHISFASSHPPQNPFELLTLTDARGTEYNQTLWPDHCVQGTRGAEIEYSLKDKLTKWEGDVKLVRKGTHDGLEAYSAFEGYITDFENPSESSPERSNEHPGELRSAEESSLSLCLKERGVHKVVLVGLATDFCVLQTALSALSSSFKTLLLGPGIRGISPEDSKNAMDKIQQLGGKIISGDDGADWENQVDGWITDG
ncbi:uncharacterized protein IL334_007553 [Kwoniella shivajii]|uniref:nicotinamidase n=1 Tax=Kwoniella shivajii TaxID=564305 RepID=A0ABZ1D8Z1_9TREE|nr:hypothetical protein IL334_007553 [Kwoniella shivajii]